jgi:hypothetical protein
METSLAPPEVPPSTLLNVRVPALPTNQTIVDELTTRVVALPARVPFAAGKTVLVGWNGIFMIEFYVYLLQGSFSCHSDFFNLA